MSLVLGEVTIDQLPMGAGTDDEAAFAWPPGSSVAKQRTARGIPAEQGAKAIKVRGLNKPDRKATRSLGSCMVGFPLRQRGACVLPDHKNVSRIYGRIT